MNFSDKGILRQTSLRDTNRREIAWTVSYVNSCRRSSVRNKIFFFFEYKVLCESTDSSLLFFVSKSLQRNTLSLETVAVAVASAHVYSLPVAKLSLKKNISSGKTIFTPHIILYIDLQVGQSFMIFERLCCTTVSSIRRLWSVYLLSIFLLAMIMWCRNHSSVDFRKKRLILSCKISSSISATKLPDSM